MAGGLPDGGYVAVMDFSKMLDHMAPELSQQDGQNTWPLS